jgi:hypothetical protein
MMATVQRGRQLHAGGAGTDDGHVQLLGPQRRDLRMRADAGIHHAGMEALGVGLRLQLQRMLADARRAEVVALAAQRQHQRVITEHTIGRDLAAFGVQVGCYAHLAPLPVQRRHLADAVAEVVPVRLRQVIHLVRTQVHAA